MDRLLRAAEQEFRKSGYAGATTAAIARRADVTEAQLFRCFPSKADLFREAIFTPLDRHFSEFQARHIVRTDDPQDLRASARLYISELQQFVAEHCEMLMSLVVARRYAQASPHGMQEIDSLGAYFDRGAAMLSTVSPSSAADPKLVVRVSFAAVLASVLFKDWLFPEGIASESAISESIIDFVIDGLGASFQPPAGPARTKARR